MARIMLPGVSRGAAKPIFEGEAASEGIFGVNFLFTRDGGQDAESISNTYEEFVEEVAVSTFRYPGGTITEQYFDITDPNSTDRVLEIDGSEQEPTVPLTTFLEYVASVGGSATIVIPTYVFLELEPDETGHRPVKFAMENALRDFINFCLTEADRLDVEITAFEIGNEWHVDNSSIFGFEMSPIEYGRVAAFVADIAQEEIDQFNLENPGALPKEPNLVVQVGPGGNAEWYTPEGFPVPEDYTGSTISATELIFQQFKDPGAQAAVDGILTHRYLHGSDEDVTGWAYNPFETWQKLASTTPGFNPNPDRYVTEWNVSARNELELGIKQFDTLVELIEEMMLAGVDHANIWAVQQRNSTRLIENTGLGDEIYGDLSFAGLAFDMMSAQLPGLCVIDGPESSAGLAVSSFGSSQRFVYFLTNRSGTERTDAIKASDLKAIGHHVTIYQVTEGPNGLPVVSVNTLNLSTASKSVSLTFSPNESMMIVVARGKSGSEIEGYSLDDSLLGSAYADTISGDDGADSIDGSTGADFLFGERGADSLLGNGDNDYLDGGADDDVIDGGTGNDTIIGGPGADIINGGEGLDVVSYASDSSNIIFDLSNISVSSNTVTEDTLIGIEGVICGSGADWIRGDAFSNLIFSGAGNDTVLGEEGNDTIEGDDGFDWLSGGAGNDQILGGAGDDEIFGSTGADKLLGGDGDDLLEGGTENDSLDGGAGSNTLSGDAGNDSLIGGSDADLIFGGDGNDIIRSGSGYDEVIGGAGADTLYGEIGNDFIDGSEGDDFLSGDVGIDTLLGNFGNDRIYGGEGGDLIYGGAGNDSIDGGSEADLIFGGDGSDTLQGGDGFDELDGGLGNDSISGGSSDDTIYGSYGNDSIFGGLGNDLINGGDENDKLFGDDGSDTMDAGDGEDLLSGGSGNDSMFGGGGNDTVNGGVGDDVIFGGLGNDSIIGDVGMDTLYGDDGDDTLDGGQSDDVLFSGLGVDKLSGDVGNDLLIAGLGNSILFGGADSDTFIFKDDFQSSKVSDFSDNSDTLMFDRSLNVNDLGTVDFINEYGRIEGGAAIFTFEDGRTVSVLGVVSLSDLHDDVVFM